MAATTDDEYEDLFSESSSDDTSPDADEDDEEELDEDARKLKAYKQAIDRVLWQISESAALPDPTPHLALISQLMEGQLVMTEPMSHSFNTRDLPKVLRALLSRSNLADEEVAHKVNNFVQRVLQWVVCAAEEGAGQQAVENTAEELMKVFDIECPFYLHYGHWGAEEPDSPCEGGGPPIIEHDEWRGHKLKVHEWIDARHAASNSWVHALVIEELHDRVMLTFENMGDVHNAWFDKNGPELAPLNSKCGALEVHEQWRDSLQVGDWVDVCTKLGKWVKAIIIARDLNKLKIHLADSPAEQSFAVSLSHRRIAKFTSHTSTTGWTGPPTRESPIDDRFDSETNFAELRALHWSSQHLVNNINLFGRLGGFDTALRWLQHGEGASLPCIKFMAQAFAQIADFISRDKAASFLAVYAQAVQHAMLHLSSADLRALEREDVEQMLQAMARMLRRMNDTEAHTAMAIEKFVLDLALVCFECEYLNKRLYALELMKRMADLVHDRTRYPEGLKCEAKTFGGVSLESRRPVPVAQHMCSEQFAAWLQEHKVFSGVFSSPHRAMVDSAAPLLKFLGATQQLQTEHIDMVWGCAVLPSQDVRQAALGVLRSVCLYLQPTGLAHLFSLLAALQPGAFSKHEVDLVGLIGHSKHKEAEHTAKQALMLLLSLCADGAVGVSSEMAAVAQDKLAWLLTKQQHPLLALSRGTFMQVCADNLLRHSSVVVSLELLRAIVLTFPEKAQADTQARWQVIGELEAQYSILDHLFKDLTLFKTTTLNHITDQNLHPDTLLGSTAVPGCGHSGFVGSIQARLHFLTLLLTNSTVTLRTAHIDSLWDALVDRCVCAEESEIFFLWCKQACDYSNVSGGVCIFGEEVALYLFQNKMFGMDMHSISKTGFLCLQHYLVYANKLNGQLELLQAKQGTLCFEVLDPTQLLGLDCLWQVALCAACPEVQRCVSKLVCTLPSRLAEGSSTDLRAVYSDHIQRCMLVLSNTHAPQQHQERALSLLSSLILEAERGLLCALPYRPHGAMSRGTALSLNLNQGNSKASGALKVQAHSNMTVLDLLKLAAEAYSHDESRVDLVWAGRLLLDGAKTLEQLGAAVDGSTIGVRLRREADKTAAPGLKQRTQHGAAQHVLPSLVLSSDPHCIHSLFELLARNPALAAEVWRLLMRLPTDSTMLEAMLSLQSVKSPSPDWDLLLDSSSAFKLLYQLQIIQSVLLPATEDSTQEGSTQDSSTRASWRHKFVLYGGFQHLYSLLMHSQHAFSSPAEHSASRALHLECLALVLRMISIFMGSSMQAANRLPPSSPAVCAAPGSPPLNAPPPPSPGFGSEDPAAPDYQLLVRQLSGGLGTTKVLDVVQCQELLPRLALITTQLCNSIAQHSTDQERAIVQNALDLILLTQGGAPMMSCALPSAQQLFDCLLDCHCGDIRRVSLRFFERLCNNTNQHAAHNTGAVLAVLLERLERLDTLNRASCHERFELLCWLLQTAQQHTECAVQLTEQRIHQIIAQLQGRAILEESALGPPDGVLVGLLRVVAVMLSMHSGLREAVGATLVPGLLQDLFGTPAVQAARSTAELSTAQHTAQPPRCKSVGAREAAFNLLIALCHDNHAAGHQLLQLLSAHVHSTPVAAKWSYAPSELLRVSAGRIGLRNLGNICYLNSMMQQLRMIPAFAAGIQAVEACAAPGSSSGEAVPEEDTLLHQLQLMIAALQYSHRKAFDPLNFCAAMLDYDEEPVDVRVQQDMNEFFNLLTNNLENALAHTARPRLLTEVMGGTYAHQTFGQGGSEFRGEASEPFYMSNIEVKNKTGLLEALEAQMAGEVIQGYKVEGCDTPITARRRTVIDQAPETLLMMLNRFDFNYTTFERVKLNDYFEFPLALDLAPFTKAGLAHKEQHDSAPPPLPYALKGVLIHSGTAQMGHYYSYICDRRSTDSTAQEEWYDYDDACVSRIDACELPSLAFGGEYTHNVYDSNLKKQVPRTSTRTNNAYCLVYERVHSTAQHTSSTAIPPAAIHQRVLLDNVSFLNDCHTFDPTYFSFMVSLAQQIEQQLFSLPPIALPAEQLAAQQLMSIQMLTKFAFTTLSHAKEQSTLCGMFDALRALLGRCPAGCQWLLQWLTADASMLAMLLLECPSSKVRLQVKALLVHTLRQPACQASCSEPPSTLAQRFWVCLLSIMDDARKHWAHMSEYFGIFLEGASGSTGEDSVEWLNQQCVIFWLGDFLLGNDSIEPRSRRHGNTKMGGHKRPDYEPILCAIAALVQHNTTVFKDRDWKMLCSPKLWSLCLNNGYGCKPGGPVPSTLAALCRLTAHDTAFSDFVMDILLEGIAVSNYDKILPFLDTIGSLLCEEDALQQHRIQTLLGGEEGGFLHATHKFKDQYKRCTYLSIKWLATLVPASHTLDRWMSAHREEWSWMQGWLQEYLDEKEANVQQAKTKTEMQNQLERAHSARCTLQLFDGAQQQLEQASDGADFMASVGERIARSQAPSPPNEEAV